MTWFISEVIVLAVRQANKLSLRGNTYLGKKNHGRLMTIIYPLPT